MTVSVIVATKNRTSDLQRMLETLLVQTVLPQEVVFVDQSSDDSTRTLVRNVTESLETAGRREPRMIYIWDGTLVGAGGARNVGIDRSNAEILVFLDDDVLLEKDFFEELLRVYETHPDSAGVSGVVTNYRKPSWTFRLARQVFWRGPLHDERQPIYWRSAHLSAPQPLRVRRFGSGLMSLRREALGDDRFDHGYRGAGPEDVELTWRIQPRGPLLLAPKARLFHAKSSSGREAAHWIKGDALAHYYLYYRLWRDGIPNRLCFAWLNVGYAVMASAGSVRRMSLAPWRALLEGRRLGLESALRPSASRG